MSDQPKAYLTLSFLDFLAYYVPGFIMIISIIIINNVANQNLLGSIFSSDKNLIVNGYQNGAILTLLLLIVPYVLGNLIFPLGYIITNKLKLFKIIVTKKVLGHDTKFKTKCNLEEGDDYCDQESLQFAQCMYKCLDQTPSHFNNLMITRFRTLSRFCRAMLFPIIILVLSFVTLIIYSWGKSLETLFLILFTLLISYSFYGFGKRYQNYECRWRNAVCVGCLH